MRYNNTSIDNSPNRSNRGNAPGNQVPTYSSSFKLTIDQHSADIQSLQDSLSKFANLKKSVRRLERWVKESYNTHKFAYLALYGMDITRLMDSSSPMKKFFPFQNKTKDSKYNSSNRNSNEIKTTHSSTYTYISQSKSRTSYNFTDNDKNGESLILDPRKNSSNNVTFEYDVNQPNKAINTEIHENNNKHSIKLNSENQEIKLDIKNPIKKCSFHPKCKYGKRCYFEHIPMRECSMGTKCNIKNCSLQHLKPENNDKKSNNLKKSYEYQEYDQKTKEKIKNHQKLIAERITSLSNSMMMLDSKKTETYRKMKDDDLKEAVKEVLLYQYTTNEFYEKFKNHEPEKYLFEWIKSFDDTYNKERAKEKPDPETVVRLQFLRMAFIEITDEYKKHGMETKLKKHEEDLKKINKFNKADTYVDLKVDRENNKKTDFKPKRVYFKKHL